MIITYWKLKENENETKQKIHCKSKHCGPTKQTNRYKRTPDYRFDSIESDERLNGID